ncbi:MAG: hypothetical protein PWP27_1390 [Clostridiales bacterium]|jgi:hypothetical protein|nr:hypothetical protein [Clostridiales bacterium]MDK2933580.1 hypothetical protein [Clostridiales bacterium]
MEEKKSKKSLVQRIVEANILGDGNLVNVKPSDVLIQSFEAYGSEELEEKEQMKTEK